MALSSDGSTALIGAYFGGARGSGAAYVFHGSWSTWTQMQELTAADGISDDYFAISVALSSDGGTLLMGATNHNFSTGAAYVFTSSATATPTNTPIPPTYTPTTTPAPPTSTPTTTPAPPTATSTPTASASISLNRSSGRYKDNVALVSSGFGNGETVNVYLDSTAGTPLASTTSTISGNLNAVFSVPQAISGTHTILAAGQSSGRDGSAPFVILPGAYLQYYQGYKGTIDVLKGAGFAPHETVIGYWNSPGGTPFPLTATTNNSGSFGSSALYPGITFTVPLSPTGQYPVYAIGQSSHGVAHATFTLKPALSVKPTSAHPGSTVTVTGTGFGANETVTLKYNCGTSGCPSTQVLGTPSTAGNGAFSVPVTLPSTTSLGTHSIGAKGASSGVFATTFITIT